MPEWAWLQRKCAFEPGRQRGHVNQILLATQAASHFIASTPRIKESVISQIGMRSMILEVGNGNLDS